MARLHVSAEATYLGPAVQTGPTFSQERPYIVVQVTDADGSPVTGLKQSNFTLRQMGGIVVVSKVPIFVVLDAAQHPEGLPGFYIVRPETTSIAVGEDSFVFVVSVARAVWARLRADRGDALVRIERAPKG